MENSFISNPLHPSSVESFPAVLDLSSNGTINLADGRTFHIKKMMDEKGQNFLLAEEQKQAMFKFCNEIFNDISIRNNQFIQSIEVSRTSNNEVEITIKNINGEEVIKRTIKNLSFSSPIKIVLSTASSAKSIKHSYTIDDKEYGQEVVTREATLPQQLKILQHMIEHLESKIDRAPPEKQQSIIQEIAFYKQELAYTKEYLKEHKDWLDSNYFRDLIKRCKSYADAVDMYISAPINMRYQELKIEGQKTIGLYRLGVISDMRNGWISLKDLQDLQKKRDPEFHQWIKDKIKEINSQRKRGLFKSLSPNQKQSIKMAIEELEKLQKIDNPRERSQAIRQLIAGRKQALQLQMLQLVDAQVKCHLDKVQASLESPKPTFRMIHVGLLNPKKKVLDKTGWMHDERVEMEDMQEIFRQFEGKTLVFDHTGPWMDEEKGEIHLPYQLPVANQTLKLETFFLNTSVQSYTKITDPEKVQNKHALFDLFVAYPDLATKFKENNIRLTQVTHSSYELAEKLIETLLSEDTLAVSTGCLSAKDRTGFVAARVIQNTLTQYLQALGFKKNPFEKDILKSDHPAMQILAENTPHFRVIKLNVFEKWPGFSVADRAKHLFALAKASFFSKTPPLTS